MEYTLTDAEALSLFGGLVGGALVAIFVFAIIVYVIFMIAAWKIFTKAGEAGWKSLIPIYNVYVLCKIVGISFWIWVIGIPFAVGIVAGVINNDSVTKMLESIYSLVLGIYLSIKLGKAFGKSNAFIVGLIFLGPIFELILAFDDSKYIGINN